MPWRPAHRSGLKNGVRARVRTASAMPGKYDAGSMTGVPGAMGYVLTNPRKGTPEWQEGRIEIEPLAKVEQLTLCDTKKKSKRQAAAIMFRPDGGAKFELRDSVIKDGGVMVPVGK